MTATSGTAAAEQQQTGASPGPGGTGPPVLDVRDLEVAFPGGRGNADVTAVRGVSYEVRRGEILGIVGESGSGKSVSSLASIGLLPDYARVRGSIRLHGEELLGLDDAAMAHKRGRAISMVFQDPLSGLTPVYTVGDQVAEAVRVHNPGPRASGPANARSNCSPWSASPTPSAAGGPSPTNSPAACASAS